MYGRMALIVVSGLIVAGCGGSEERQLLEMVGKNHRVYETLAKTEKLVYSQGREDEKILYISYLGTVGDREKFIISLYPDIDSLPSSITLEGTSPQSVKRLAKSDIPQPLRRSVPSWFSTYSVEFPLVTIDKFRIIVPPLESEERAVYFYKDMRYVVDKKRRILR